MTGNDGILSLPICCWAAMADNPPDRGPQSGVTRVLHCGANRRRLLNKKRGNTLREEPCAKLQAVGQDSPNSRSEPSSLNVPRVRWGFLLKASEGPGTDFSVISKWMASGYLSVFTDPNNGDAWEYQDNCVICTSDGSVLDRLKSG